LADNSGDHLSIFSSRPPPKKKRKSRTAFTNHQIFELERKFLHQKSELEFSLSSKKTCFSLLKKV